MDILQSCSKPSLRWLTIHLIGVLSQSNMTIFFADRCWFHPNVCLVDMCRFFYNDTSLMMIPYKMCLYNVWEMYNVACSTYPPFSSIIFIRHNRPLSQKPQEHLPIIFATAICLMQIRLFSLQYVNALHA